MVPVVFDFSEIQPADGELILAMIPQARYAKIAKRQFSLGDEYPLVVLEARSRASHNHFHAAIHEGFTNLPEGIAVRFPTENHLRRWVLIETGWFDEKEFDCETAALARRLAAFVRTQTEYARISIHGSKVIVREAKSQSAAAMGKQAFEDSKRDVLDYLATMIGTTWRGKRLPP